MMYKFNKKKVSRTYFRHTELTRYSRLIGGSQSQQEVFLIEGIRKNIRENFCVTY